MPSSPATPGSPGATAPSSSTASAAGGRSELEVLEPEPPSSSSAAADGEESGESGGESAAESTAQGGGEAGSPAEAGGPQGGADAAAGGEAGGAAGGAEASATASAGGMPGGGSESLDATLDASLEGFEGEMQKQIMILASNRPPEDLEGGSESSGSAGEEEIEGETGEGGEAPGLVLVDDPSQLPPAAGEAGSGQTATSGAISEDGGMPGQSANRQGANANARISSRVPGDIGDGSDDDVVARQIREAAMNESDPVLREKLWEEYRNYKKSIR